MQTQSVQTLFYLEVIPNIASGFYENALLVWVQECLPGVTVFAWDNLSDGVLQEHARRLLRLSEKCILIVEVRSAGAGLTAVLPFLEALISRPDALIVRMGERHPVLERFITLLPPERAYRAADMAETKHRLEQWLLSS